MFIPSPSLALGAWSEGSRLFEVAYLLFWYIGPMNKVPALDYVGALDETLARGLPLVYLLGTAGLGLLAEGGEEEGG